MTRPRLLALLLPVAVLAGCAGSADPADIAAKAEPQGIAADLVYVTEIDGFEPNPMSVGVMGDDGFSTMYSGEVETGIGTVMLTTSRSESDAPRCAELEDPVEPVISCTATPADGVVVLLEGDNVDAELLRDAADALRVPTAKELDTLFSEMPAVEEPPARGDLPPGDGAPVDPPGAGG